VEEGDLGECLKHGDGGDGEEKHILVSCWTHSLFLSCKRYGGKEKA